MMPLDAWSMFLELPVSAEGMDGWRYSGSLRRLSVRGVLCENVRGSNLWRLMPGVTLEHARNVACVLFTEVHG